MTGMSARQFESDIKRKVKKAFGKATAQDIAYDTMLQRESRAKYLEDGSVVVNPHYNPAKRFDDFYFGVTVGPFWHCPYCDANHDLAVKFCDCCGARRRREYVH